MLLALVAGWVTVFGLLVYRQHDRFGSYTFDMGIFDQAVWLLSQGDGLFITVRGLEFFGHHANLGLVLFAPFYRLGAGPHLLNLVQVVSMALGAVPVFLLARDRLANAWLALPLAAAYLLHPALGFMTWELFHPEVMAITPLLFAYWFARHRRWGWFAGCAVYAVSWKEDVALAVFMLGLVLLLRKEWRAGAVTAAAALGWFLFVNRVLLPGVGGDAFYNHLFGSVGGTPLGVVKTALLDPTRITDRFLADDARTYVWKMGAPFAFLPVLAPAAFGLGAPQLFLNLVSGADFTRLIYYHFSALPLAGLTVATVEGIGFVARRRRAREVLLVGVVAATSIAGAALWGVSPIGAEYDAGWWRHGTDPRRAAKEAALSLPPAGSSVSAIYTLAPHLTHRREIYDWPNPWIGTNWGLRNDDLPDPDAVDWVVVDRHLLGPADAALLDRLLDAEEFGLMFDRDGVVVARRLRPGSPTPG